MPDVTKPMKRKFFDVTKIGDEPKMGGGFWDKPETTSTKCVDILGLNRRKKRYGQKDGK